MAQSHSFLSRWFCWLQDPDAGPAMVGNACTQVGSVSVPPQTIRWTCGIAVKGDYACGGGAPPAPSALGSTGVPFQVHVPVVFGHVQSGSDSGKACVD